MLKKIIRKTRKIVYMKIIWIILTLIGLVVIWQGYQFSLLGLVVMFLALKMYNKAFVSKFEKVNNGYVHYPDHRIKWLKNTMILGMAFCAIFIGLFSTPIYKLIMGILALVPLLVYNMADRYTMVALSGNPATIVKFFEKKKKGMKVILWSALILCFIPYMYYVFGVVLVIGLLRLMLIKLLYSETNNLVFVEPAPVYSKKENAQIHRNMGVEE
jgi:hypothetical protein